MRRLSHLEALSGEMCLDSENKTEIMAIEGDFGSIYGRTWLKVDYFRNCHTGLFKEFQ